MLPQLGHAADHLRVHPPTRLRHQSQRFEREAVSGGLKPYLHVRRDLWAKVTRALFYDLVELGEERDVGSEPMFGVASSGAFFPMTRADALKDLD